MRSAAAVIDKAPFFPVEMAESAIIRRGHEYWHALKGERAFPSREMITLRGLRDLAKYATLIKVIEGGRDYEFRLVGDVPVAAVGKNFRGRRLSEPDVLRVMESNYRRQFYDMVVRTAEPWLFKSRMVDHIGLNLPVHSETVYLPLGEGDVDHLLGFTVFAAEGAGGYAVS